MLMDWDTPQARAQEPEGQATASYRAVIREPVEVTAVSEEMLWAVMEAAPTEVPRVPRRREAGAAEIPRKLRSALEAAWCGLRWAACSFATAPSRQTECTDWVVPQEAAPVGVFGSP